MSTTADWLAAVRGSHDRLAGIVAALDAGELERPSACAQWTVAQVLSHLGSQAEIFSLFVDAGAAGVDAPPRDAFGPIWDAWNARSPQDQATDSISANEVLVSRLEMLDDVSLRGFRLELFGRTLDADGLLRMRLSEHSVHTWDVEVAFDATAVVAGDAVDLLIDGLGETASRSGRAPAEPLRASVSTSSPARRFTLVTADDVRLEPAGATDEERSIALPAEVLLRLVYGRLGDDQPARGPVTSSGVELADLRQIFEGY